MLPPRSRRRGRRSAWRSCAAWAPGSFKRAAPPCQPRRLSATPRMTCRRLGPTSSHWPRGVLALSEAGLPLQIVQSLARLAAQGAPQYVCPDDAPGLPSGSRAVRPPSACCLECARRLHPLRRSLATCSTPASRRRSGGRRRRPESRSSIRSGLGSHCPVRGAGHRSPRLCRRSAHCSLPTHVSHPGLLRQPWTSSALVCVQLLCRGATASPCSARCVRHASCKTSPRHSGTQSLARCLTSLQAVFAAPADLARQRAS